MPQETKSHTERPPGKPDSLQGLVATREDELALLDALEQAFDYRGDVTLTLTDGQQVAGYIFDRRRGDGLADSSVRLLTPTSDQPQVVRYDHIDRVEFSGKDTAHGKSFERWVERYIEKKLAEQSNKRNEGQDGHSG